MFRASAALIPVSVLLAAVLAAAPQQEKDGAGKKAPTPPAIETDAKAALARQWMNWEPAGKQAPWDLCLSALDLATQAQPKYSDALTVLELGYDGTSQPKYPYTVPAASADRFWDWVAGAGDSDKTKPEAALKAVQGIVDQYYLADNRGLMEKVDANFSAKNPRRAIFELLAYKAKETRAAQRKAAADSGAAVRASLAELEDIRLCYASAGDPKDEKVFSCRKMLVDYVAAKFRSPSK